jgi:N-acetylglucosamine kinase-like BadF-type ATPase
VRETIVTNAKTSPAIHPPTGVHRPVWVGVDGGGSKTEAWVATGDVPSVEGLQVLGRGLAAASNLKQVGLDRSVERIVQAVTSACEKAGLALGVAARAHVGLAGAGRAADRARVEAELSATGVALSWGVSDDVSPVLAAGRALAGHHADTTPGPAVVLVSGTGSMAWGTDGRGKIARAGGLGPVFGDEGSGYTIGREALRLACQVVEQRAPNTGTLACVLSYLGLAGADELLDWCRSGEPLRRTIAGLAERIIQSSSDDAQADKIVRRAIVDLAGLVQSVRSRTTSDLQADWLLVVTGGVLVHHETVRSGVLRSVLTEGEFAPRLVVVPHPVLGSLLTAARSHEPGIIESP